MTGTLVSVVVPTYNRLARLRRVLQALAAQTFPTDRFEVVVVSDGSSDGTDRAVPAMDVPYRLVFVAQPNSGPAAARNRGIECARGELVLFVDDDVVAAPCLVARHVDAHRAVAAPSVVVGPMLDPPDFAMSSWVRWQQRMLYRQYAELATARCEPTFRQFYTGNASAPRAALLEVGGFDHRYRRSEDLELAYRLAQAGLRFVFDPEASAFHYAQRTFDEWLQSARDYGANDVAFARDHGRDDVLPAVAHDFTGRHALVRWTVRACVASPRVDRAVEATMTAAVQVADITGVPNVAQAALSGLFNCAYYTSVAAGLGGRRPFRHAVVRPG